MNIFLYKDLKPTKHDDLNSESRVLAFGASVMMREEHFAQAGAVVQLHSHAGSEQITHVIKGSIEFLGKDGVVLAVLKVNDSVHVGFNEIHGVRVLEDDTIVRDSFSPIRIDHLMESIKDNDFAEAFSGGHHKGSIESDS